MFGQTFSVPTDPDTIGVLGSLRGEEGFLTVTMSLRTTVEATRDPREEGHDGETRDVIPRPVRYLIDGVRPGHKVSRPFFKGNQEREGG